MHLRIALALIVAAVAAGTGLALADTAVVVACTRGGIHYVGTSAQHQKVCFTRTRSGKSLIEIEFGGRYKCPGGSDTGIAQVGPGDSWSVDVGGDYILGTGGGSGPIATVANGSFDYGIRGSQMLTEFKGKITRAGVATGTLRSRGDFDGAVCDTGVVRWTARRTAH